MYRAVPRITKLRLLVVPSMRRQKSGGGGIFNLFNPKKGFLARDTLADKLFLKQTPKSKGDNDTEVKEPESTYQDRLRRKLFRDPDSLDEKAEEQVESLVDDGYVEALDGRELRVVGLDPELDEWDVPTFLTNPKFENPTSIIRAVHRSVVEVYTTSLNGLQVSDFNVSYTGPENLTEAVSIRVSPGGEAVFDYSDPEIERGILDSPRTEAELEIRAYTEDEVYPSEEVPEWVREGLERTGWAGLGLRKDAKFAVIKRVMQLTGIKIPDPEVTKMKTVAHLLEHLEYKPKPKKLFEVLVESDLPSLPNVKIFGSRLRPWDKEKMIGRERPFEKVVEFKYPFEVKDGKS